MKVTVIIATCGGEEWSRMGDEALISIKDRFPVEIIRVHKHDKSLAETRNYALGLVSTEYVCFVDADDTIKDGYFDFEPTSDVTVTAISYNGNEATIPPVWYHMRGRKGYHEGECTSECLVDGNYIHIGAIMKTSAAKDFKFREYPVYEDYAWWLELQQNGLTFSKRPESVYKASVRENKNHRNRSMTLTERNKVHMQIYEDITGLPWSR